MQSLDPQQADMSKPLIALMKGVVFKEKDETLWQSLENVQIAIRDYVKVLGLELILDEAEGYAFLKTGEAGGDQEPLPRLVGRRKLSYPVSLIIALLRKKLAENDASGEATRLVLSVEEIADLVRVFFSYSGNEARFLDNINSHLNKIADMGFIRRLKNQPDQIEVVRILKAFVDAQWLHEFNDRLREYQKSLAENQGDGK